MKLLQHSESPGYPTEYIISRISGRRARFIREWKQLVFDPAPGDYLSSSRYQGFMKVYTPEAVWKDLLRENRWLYLQMNKELRKIFIPYFLYVELRTIFICLRQAKQDPNSGKTFDLLKSSLLSDEVKKLFMSNPNAGSAVKSLGRMFTPLSEKFAGWSAIFESGGLRALEQHIANTYLAVTAEKRLHPVMKNFFQHLIDARNIMAVYKYNRLEQSIHPPIIPGGKIPLTRFRSILVSGDSFGLNSLIEKFFGMKIETPEPTRVETALYTGITRFLKKESREHPVEGFILDYLWKCSLQVMNVSVVLTGKDLEREAVIAEIVQ